MIGKTNSLNIVSGGSTDVQVTNFIKLDDTLDNVYTAYNNGDTSAYFTPLKEQCDIWLSSGSGKVNFTPKPCVLTLTDNKLLLTSYKTMTFGSQYAHLYRFSCLLSGLNYYELEIGILASVSTAEADSTAYEVADIYMSKTTLIDNNVSIGSSSASTSGTISEEDLSALENNDHKLIDLVGELYIKSDTRTNNQMVYTCLKNDSVPIVKFITINTSTRGWVLTQKALVEEEKVMTDSFTVTLADMKSAVNGKKSYHQSNAPSAIRNFILAQEGIFDLTITTPIGALGITLYPSLWKDEVNSSRNFEGVITIDTDLSAIGASSQLNQIVCTAIAWTTEGSTTVDYRYTIIPIEEQASPSGTVTIEKVANQDGTFTVALTADEFNKLADNQATLKLTYMFYGMIPVIVNLANPVKVDSGDVVSIMYTKGIVLESPSVWIPTIVSTDLTRINLASKVNDSTPVCADTTSVSYEAISDYPLLGFVENVADQAVLAIPKSYEIGECIYNYNNSGAWSFFSASGTGAISSGYLNKWITHVNLYTQDVSATTLEAILMLKDGEDAYKRYSTIVHIGGTNTTSSTGSLGSEGLFTVYDTTTHKPIYITFNVSADAATSSVPIAIENFKAYQDGTDITSTFLTKVYGIKLFLL